MVNNKTKLTFYIGGNYFILNPLLLFHPANICRDTNLWRSKIWRVSFAELPQTSPYPPPPLPMPDKLKSTQSPNKTMGVAQDMKHSFT